MLSETTHLTLEPVSRLADWERAVSFQDFLTTATQHVDLWTGLYERFAVPAEATARAESVAGTWHLLVLSEDWCGDASNTVPVVARLAQAASNLDLRLLARDENLDLMDAHLTNGSRGIPVVILLDGQGVERGWWGPRPADLQRWVMTEGKTFDDHDEKYLQVRKWYARDRGQTTLDEVLGLLEAAAGRPTVA
jgi:hypothetical protein